MPPPGANGSNGANWRREALACLLLWGVLGLVIWLLGLIPALAPHPGWRILAGFVAMALAAVGYVKVVNRRRPPGGP